MNSDPNFSKKLPLYKTAYSLVYQTYVGILNISYTTGEPILDCYLAGDSTTIIQFHPSELTQYCL